MIAPSFMLVGLVLSCATRSIIAAPMLPGNRKVVSTTDSAVASSEPPPRLVLPHDPITTYYPALAIPERISAGTKVTKGIVQDHYRLTNAEKRLLKAWWPSIHNNPKYMANKQLTDDGSKTLHEWYMRNVNAVPARLRSWSKVTQKLVAKHYRLSGSMKKKLKKWWPGLEENPALMGKNNWITETGATAVHGWYALNDILFV